MAINTQEKTLLLSNLAPKWNRVDAVWGGTDVIREQGELYLYRNPLEGPQYADRLKRATLNGAFKRTIKKGVGKAFALPMEVILPSDLEYLELNCDRAGTSLQTFAKQALEETLKYGVYYILVDTPDTPVNSLYEQQAFNVRPFFVGIRPTQVNIIETDIINNEQVLTRFNYNFNIDETVYQADFTLADGSVDYTLIVIEGDETGLDTESKTIALDRIPIVPLYGNKIAPFIGTPVLDELLHLVLKHYWKQSELDWNEHFGLTPILQMAGAQNSPDAETGKGELDHYKLGASTMVLTDAQGDVQWTTADSAGIAVGHASLDRLLKEIDSAGLELTVKSESSETATGRKLDAAEANSILKGVVVDLEWSLYQCIVIAGQYMNIDASDADINLDTEYTVDNGSDLTLIMTLFEKGILSRDEVRLEIKALRFLNNETVINALDVASDGTQTVAE